ncbi:hypothetical protein HanRHA438_Chr12g0576511 [Helianthus annuus]|nr:hypothetical protein HanRHA438_Chr12g0576511 [Helianthus annuus]
MQDMFKSGLRVVKLGQHFGSLNRFGLCLVSGQPGQHWKQLGSTRLGPVNSVNRVSRSATVNGFGLCFSSDSRMGLVGQVLRFGQTVRFG